MPPPGGRDLDPPVAVAARASSMHPAAVAAVPGPRAG